MRKRKKCVKVETFQEASNVTVLITFTAFQNLENFDSFIYRKVGGLD